MSSGEDTNLTNLENAWREALDKNLIAGQFWTVVDVQVIAHELAEMDISEEQARDVLQASTRIARVSGVAIDEEIILDMIWEIIYEGETI